jgi:hypothetical protein
MATPRQWMNGSPVVHAPMAVADVEGDTVGGHPQRRMQMDLSALEAGEGAAGPVAIIAVANADVGVSEAENSAIAVDIVVLREADTAVPMEEILRGSG